MHALIIEDETFTSLTIQGVLADNGCTSFDFASSFTEAVAAAARRRPDLITADVRLAPGNGVDAVQAIARIGIFRWSSSPGPEPKRESAVRISS